MTFTIFHLHKDGEEFEVASRKVAGDEAALEELVKANLRFVVTIAKKYQNKGVELAGLVCEGNRGLMIAAKKFDPSWGVKFISFAVWLVRQKILFAINNGSFVKTPINHNQKKKQLLLVLEKHKKMFGRELDPFEACELLGYTKAVVEAVVFDGTTHSINTSIGSEGENNTRLDYIPSGISNPEEYYLIHEDEALKEKRKRFILNLIMK